MSESQVIKYCGTTNSITSEDFSSCTFAWGSFVFAILTGVSIGAISLSNIIGVAYTHKKASLTTLLILVCIFEGLGMILMSRFTLVETVTNTIDFTKITNLRLGFIALGSTQMCSALILVNVLIFALPMSTTQVVISGLIGVSLIYFSAVSDHISWFILEIVLWTFFPIIGMAMSYVTNRAFKKYVF